MKTCIRCGISRQSVQFYNCKRSKDGKKSVCKHCMKKEREEMKENKRKDEVKKVIESFTVDTIRERAKRDMIKLDIYKPEFDTMIQAYAQVRHQYEILTQKFEKSGYKYEESTVQGGTKKTALVLALETYRKDVLTYSDRLGLTPKAYEQLKKEQEEEKANPFARRGIGAAPL